MDKKDRRQKASDVFAQSKFFLGEKTSDFSRAFPNISKLKVILTEEGEGVYELLKTRHYDETNLPGEYIDCHNPMCYNGGVHIGQILYFMVERGETEREETIFCQGYEGSPKGRKKYDSCDNRFTLKINIAYKG